jgi:hypothetical protein
MPSYKLLQSITRNFPLNKTCVCRKRRKKIKSFRQAIKLFIVEFFFSSSTNSYILQILQPSNLAKQKKLKLFASFKLS